MKEVDDMHNHLKAIPICDIQNGQTDRLFIVKVCCQLCWRA